MKHRGNRTLTIIFCDIMPTKISRREMISYLTIGAGTVAFIASGQKESRTTTKQEKVGNLLRSNFVLSDLSEKEAKLLEQQSKLSEQINQLEMKRSEIKNKTDESVGLSKNDNGIGIAEMLISAVVVLVGVTEFVFSKQDKRWIEEDIKAPTIILE